MTPTQRQTGASTAVSSRSSTTWLEATHTGRSEYWSWSKRLHEVGCCRFPGCDVDRKQGGGLCEAGIARDPMNRARRFPPCVSGVEHLFGLVADFGGNRA